MTKPHDGSKTSHRPSPDPTLRARAEEKLRTIEAVESEKLSIEKTRVVLHELRVHQIELEMQNEELRKTQTALEIGRARYFDLYDLAPVGYCTLSAKGIILTANLTAATMLGTTRSALAKSLFSSFIHGYFCPSPRKGKNPLSTIGTGHCATTSECAPRSSRIRSGGKYL